MTDTLCQEPVIRTGHIYGYQPVPHTWVLHAIQEQTGPPRETIEVWYCSRCRLVERRPVWPAPLA